MKKYVFLTTWGESLPVAWHLQQEGKTVIVGIVDDMRSVGLRPESSEEKKRRTRVWGNILDVRKAESLVESMKDWTDKDEWFVFCDFNNQWRLANKLNGFKYGLFPTRFDFEMEGDRNLAKDFVQKHYPLVKLPECHEFKTVEEAQVFLEDSEEFWALKGNDPSAETVVPGCQDLEHAKEEMLDALMGSRQSFESKGFILERQIRDGCEINVEGMWWDGKMISASIDIEHKTLGSGNTGYQVGCGGNIICQIPTDCELVTIGIPEAIHKIASRRRGLYFADCNLILKDGEFYYLESGFRPGYDSFVAQVEMAGGPSEFFESVCKGENPLKCTYGVGIRGFNLRHDEKGAKDGIRMRFSAEDSEHLCPFGMYNKDGSYLDSAYIMDVVVATGASDDAEYAAQKAYQVLARFSYDSLYYRPEHDWFDRSYHGNIHSRIEGIERYITDPE